ncbi:hypothetical protein [Janibacter limosus]|uniref:hypothetical protein n=1 Tax=Janibacter limosus TaxID=53458 RepID=UPI000ADBD03E|nr:hypothetical protein [Janibacter limosus]
MTSHLAAHTSDGPSRRTVAKTAAWAVPAVTVAAAAPTLAASTATIDLALEAQPFGDGITTYRTTA